jgi:hypothetical protein
MPLVEAKNNKGSKRQKEFPSDENKEAFRSSRAQLKRDVQRANNRSEYKKTTKIYG